MRRVDLVLSMPLRMVSSSSLTLSVGFIFQWFRMPESIEQVAGPFCNPQCNLPEL